MLTFVQEQNFSFIVLFRNLTLRRLKNILKMYETCIVRLKTAVVLVERLGYQVASTATKYTGTTETNSFTLR